MPLSFDFASLRNAYRRGDATPAEVVRDALRRITAQGEDAVWISRFSDDVLLAEAAALERRAAMEERDAMPLYGIPFAVKDNIDVAGLPTTAACPAFSYQPMVSAPVVERLRRAGALAIGKTNLDQFATGLVGTRSPYGIPRNPFDPDYIPGGSSSGSAVAVAAGLVGFALGTDTAGSGRVPASFNNIVGLKPTPGLLSTKGVVPACASLDCVSVFALTVADAAAVLSAAHDDAINLSSPAPARAKFRFGVPRVEERQFLGDEAAGALFDTAINRMEAAGGHPVAIDLAPFVAAGRLVYAPGPWLAERREAVDRALGGNRDLLLPVTRQVIAAGDGILPADITRGHACLAELTRQTARVWRQIEFLLVPTTQTIFRIGDIAADPIGCNALLGHYTNFVNPLGLSAVALPNGFLPNGLPAGVTLIGPALQEQLLISVGGAFARLAGLPLGANAAAFPP